MANPTPPEPNPTPQLNRFLSLTLPGCRSVGCGGCLLVAVLFVGGLVALVTFVISLLPYKVHCNGAGGTAHYGAGDRAAAEAYAREQEQKGMSCIRQYPRR